MVFSGQGPGASEQEQSGPRKGWSEVVGCRGGGVRAAGGQEFPQCEVTAAGPDGQAGQQLRRLQATASDVQVLCTHGSLSLLAWVTGAWLCHVGCRLLRSSVSLSPDEQMRVAVQPLQLLLHSVSP